jgi:hypothetical protein
MPPVLESFEMARLPQNLVIVGGVHQAGTLKPRSRIVAQPRDDRANP